MAIRLVALDLDGTLLDKDKTLPSENIKEITRLAERGVHFTYCTGRIMGEMDYIIKALPAVRYAVICNGSYTLNLAEGKTVASCTLSVQETEQIYALCRDFDMIFELMGTGKVICEERFICESAFLRFHREHISGLLLRTREGVPDMSSYLAQRNEPAGKINMIFTNGQTRDEAHQRLLKLPFNIVRPDFNTIELNPHGISKGTSLCALGKSLGIEPNEIMAIGDSDNDSAMLKSVGVPVAMGNADEAIKSLACFVTAPNFEGGVAKALRHFFN